MPDKEDNLKKDVLWLGAISGILGGLFDADCIVDGIVEDVDPEVFDEFFLDEQGEKERKWEKHQRKNVQTAETLYT